MAEGFDKSEMVLREVAVRADERRRWAALMAEHHYLGSSVAKPSTPSSSRD